MKSMKDTRTIKNLKILVAPDSFKGNMSAPAAAAAMERLNRYAAEALAGFGAAVHGCTDVTGFGLAVHAAEMAAGRRTLVIDGASLPLLPGAQEFAEGFLATAAGQRNRAYLGDNVDVSALSPAAQEIVFDPQTSGGLLVACAAEAAGEVRDAIAREDPAAAIIGVVAERERAAVVFV